MAGRQEGRAGRRHRGRGRRRHMVAREDRARRAADRLGRRRRTPRCRAPRSPRCSRRASTPSRPSSATRAATPRRRSPAPRRRSRRSTPIRTRTTRTMEPMNATALYTADAARSGARRRTARRRSRRCAEAAGLPGRQMRRLQMRPRRRLRPPRPCTTTSRQAVLIAKQMPGTPVKLMWSREEDMTHGRYHPITQCKMTGGLDAHGNVTALHMRISGQSILASVLPAEPAERHGSGGVPGPQRRAARKAISATRFRTC